MDREGGDRERRRGVPLTVLLGRTRRELEAALLGGFVLEALLLLGRGECLPLLLRVADGAVECLMIAGVRVEGRVLCAPQGAAAVGVGRGRREQQAEHGKAE